MPRVPLPVGRPDAKVVAQLDARVRDAQHAFITDLRRRMAVRAEQRDAAARTIRAIDALLPSFTALPVWPTTGDRGGRLLAARARERRQVLVRVLQVRDQERAALMADLAQAETELAMLAAPRMIAYGPFVLPVQPPAGYGDTWGAPRVGHRHEGTDIFAALGTPVRASVDGTIREFKVTHIGGLVVYLLSADGTYYYYAHLRRFVPGLRAGAKVRAGEVLGFVGRSGNADGTPPHLHFEIHPLGAKPVNPYPVLRAVERSDRAAFERYTVPLAALCEERRRAALPSTVARPTTAPARPGRGGPAAAPTTTLAATVAPTTVPSTASTSTTSTTPPPTIAPGACPKPPRSRRGR